MKVNLERLNHSCTRLRYHIVLVCKYRRGVINSDIETELRRIFTDIATHSKFRILHMGFDVDHVHLFVRSIPEFSVLEIVRRLKQVSTRRLWKCRESYLRGFYWKRRVLWTNGYYCSTVGEMSENTVINYIRNQGNSPAKLKI